METPILTLTFQECRTRYGFTQAELQDFLLAGLLQPAAAPDTILVDEPDELPRLARLHYEFGLPAEALDIILAMRRRLEQLQAALVHETARARQLERFLQGGPLVEL
jgi:chaperone modulatory protein CbpM